MLVRVERSDYLTTWARVRGIASTVLVRLIRIISSDQLVGVPGEVIGKRKKLPGFAPSKYCAPESDGA
jgi:hypothetical protein